MERELAIAKLQKRYGHSLQNMATEYNVVIEDVSGTVNKGWAGHVCEQYLGLPINSSKNPDFGDWELKTIPLKFLKNGKLSFKETMAVTMINPEEVVENDFANSHLLQKLERLVVVARIVGETFRHPSTIYSATSFDLNGELYEIVKNDYELIRKTIKMHGMSGLSGKIGELIQPRTKGAGHGSTSRAFYAKNGFLKLLITFN